MSNLISNLLCEYAKKPVGIDVLNPRFIWSVKGPGKAILQTKFQLIVSSNEQKAKNMEGDSFDSGIVCSDLCLCDYNGKKLESCERYYFRVRFCDNNGVWSDFSEIEYFEMAILDESLWEGSYIGVPNAVGSVTMFRKKVVFSKKIVKARAYLATEGFSELYVNGSKQGDAVLDPANTDFNVRLLYVTYDITSSMRDGCNVFGVMLNNGWSNHGKFRLQVFIWFDDGSKESVYTSPDNWFFVISPILLATIYSGEVYNAIYERPEWCLPTDDFENKYNLTYWRMHSEYMPKMREENPAHFDKYAYAYYNAYELTTPPGMLQAQFIEPIKVIEEIKPVSICKDPKGNFVIDFGQNFAGWIKMKMRGPVSSTITMKFTEFLDEDGSLSMEYLRVADPTYKYPMQTDVYMLKGEDDEEYCQRFTYHGFKFVGVEGYEGELTLNDITGYVVHSSVKQSGDFNCSNKLINQIQKNILWTERSNLYGIPTDCPQRSERQGWLNDMTARAESAVYNFNLKLLYTKFARDITDTQDPVSGAIGDTAPYRRGFRPADPVDSSYLIVPQLVYHHYGDERPIIEHYTGMKKWTDFLERNSQDGIISVSLWGDWASPVPNCGENGLFSAVSAITPGDFVSSGYLYFNVCTLLEFAGIIGNKAEENYYFELEKKLKKKLNDTYYDAETKNYATGSQGCNTFALYLKIVPENDIDAVVKNIVTDVEKNDFHITTGNLFTKYLLEMLAFHGQVDTAFKLAVQTTYPSWGYMVEMGATTIWERWEHATGYGMNSHSHPMYGSVSAWYYKYLAGISPLTAGFRKIQIKPSIPSDLNKAKATIKSFYGDILSSWEKTDGGLILEVEIPSCTEAEIYVPIYFEEQKVYENGKIIGVGNEMEGINVIERSKNYLKLSVGSGKYAFKTAKQ